MNIGKTLYVTNRKAWRAWLSKHHSTGKGIWLIYYKKDSGRARIPYDDAVEEALCYGWIDSIVKPIDKAKYAQRFSPRRPNSQLSELNKERIRRLIKAKKMTRFGIVKIEHAFTEHTSKTREKLRIPPNILKALKSDPNTWKNFSQFSETYKRIRIGWLIASQHRPSVFQQRLRYFLKMTAQNKRYGMVQ